MQGDDLDLERFSYTRVINGSPQKLARMRVTKKGHGLIFTGEIDPVTNRSLKFSEGDICEGPFENLLIYEARGFAKRLPPPTLPTGEGRPNNPSWPTSEARVGHRGGPPPGTNPTLPPGEGRPNNPSWPTSEARVGHRGGPPPGTPRDTDAITRLTARSLRDEKNGCLIWQGSKANGGYGQITYRRRHFTTHRLSWIAHRGDIPPNQYVCHACDNPACIAIEHLFLGTPSENYRDMRRKRRVRYNAKLTLEDVAEIKRRLALNEPASAIAKDFTVNAEQILKIKSGLAWRDPPQKEPQFDGIEVCSNEHQISLDKT